MAKVTVVVAGGTPQDVDADTVAEAARAVDAEGYVATVNGSPAQAGQKLEDYNYVSLAKPVKAG